MVIRKIVGSFLFFLLLALMGSSTFATGGVRSVIEPTQREGLHVWLDKDCYEPGSYLTIHLKAEQSGYLTVYDMTPDGDTSILFPNAYYPDNYIEGGKQYDLPALSDPFKIRVEAPSVARPDAKEIVWGIITAEKTPLPSASGRAQVDLAWTIRSQVQALGSWWASDKCEFGYGPCDNERKGKTYALLVSIGHYADDDIPDVYPYSQNARATIQGALEASFDVVRVLNDAQATRYGIIVGIRDFLGQAGQEDTVYFYFIGHGGFVPDDNGDEAVINPGDRADEILCPYDTTLNPEAETIGTFIRDDEVHALFSELSAKWAVLHFESCHSGTAHRGIPMLGIPAFRSSLAGAYHGGSMVDDFQTRGSFDAHGPKVLALQSCQPDQTAKIKDPGSLNGTSYFAWAMGNVLSHQRNAADTNNDGWVSLQEAFNRAAPAVEQAVAEDGRGEQIPMMFDNIGHPINVVKVK